MTAMMVRDLPEDERPREKLIKQGAAFLSDAELLAILLRTGTRTCSVLHLAEEVLSVYRERGILSVMNMTPEEFSAIKGIGEAKAATVLAAVELGKRIYVKAAQKREKVNEPSDVAEYVMPQLRYLAKENFAVLLLDAKNNIISFEVVSVGDLTSSIVHPREVFQPALKQMAASIVLVHNHPSGDPAPSSEDIIVTRRLVKAGEIMGINIIDHVIIGDGCFCSLREKGLMS